MNELLENIIEEVVSDLTIILKNTPMFDEDALRLFSKNALRDAMVVRNYEATTYTDEEQAKDIYRFISVIEELAKYDYNKDGADGEVSHSENGINRTYINRDSILAKIPPFVDVI